jgi:hypothetical protein
MLHTTYSIDTGLKVNPNDCAVAVLLFKKLSNHGAWLLLGF